MADLTPDKKLLLYLKPFGIGNHQNIDNILKEIFNIPDQEKGIESKYKNVRLFLEALKNNKFIHTQKLSVSNKKYTVYASIQTEGIDYLNNSLNTETSQTTVTTKSVKKKKPTIRLIIEMTAAILTIVGCLIAIMQAFFPNSSKSDPITAVISDSTARAYINIKQIQLMPLGSDSIVTVVADIENSGKTPAYRVKGILNILVYFSEEYVDIESSAKHVINMPEVTMGAHHVDRIANNLPKRISKKEYESIMNNIYKMFVIINIVYYDTFGIEHYTHSFTEYSPVDKGFRSCKRYNDAN